MFSRKLALRIGALALLNAHTAFAIPAYDTMLVSRVRTGASARGLPSLQVTPAPRPANQGPVPNQNQVPNQPPAPSSYQIYIRAGRPVPAEQAHTGDVFAANDPRMSEGYTSCTATLSTNTLPTAFVLDGRPTTGSRTVSFASGRQVTLQQAQISFTNYDQFGQPVSNFVTCYKVSRFPMMMTDLRVALGQTFAIDLSEDQSAEMQATEALRQSIAHVNVVVPPQAVEGDMNGVRPVVSVPNAPAAPVDPIVDDSTRGSFGGRSPAQ